jgi:ribulose kinase
MLVLRTVWNSIAKACNDVLRDAKVDKDNVKGIGFDGAVASGSSLEVQY